MLNIFGWLIFIGNLVSTAGALLKNFILIIAGRVIYGFGGDSITVCQWAIVMEFFEVDEIGVPLVLLFYTFIAYIFFFS